MSGPSLGVYVHIPFCERVCPYCDFAVVAARLGPDLERRYLDALCAELEARRGVFAGRRLASLYLGGGTPSLLQPASVARLVGAVREAFAASPGEPETEGAEHLEVTLEVNPSTLERERLPGFREAGVNRLSVGIQSFDDSVLRRLGRAHVAREGRATLEACRAAGFDNVSVDLIFAAPGQGLRELEADLRETLAFAPEHVSSYELVVEEGTPFALADARGQLPRADADLAADMMETIEDTLAAAGLERYELTNHALPGRESVHNQRYWRGEPVLGLGLGAWSSDPACPAAPFGSRRRNTRSLPDYLARVLAQAPRGGQQPGDACETGTAAEEVERLAAETARGEAMFLALRTRAGLEASRFEARFGAAPRAFFEREIATLVADGLLEEGASGNLRLTRRGRLLCDLACERFVAVPEAPERPAPSAGRQGSN